MRLSCDAILSALLIALSVFIAEVGKTEYKSQLRKRKERKLELVDVDYTYTDTQDEIEYV